MHLLRRLRGIEVQPADLLLAVATPACYGTVAGWLGAHGWSLDLLSTFRIQYLVTLGAVLLVLLIARRWVSGAIVAVFFSLNAVAIAPFYWPAPTRWDGYDIRVAMFNVYTRSREYGSVVSAIRESDADLVALLEVDARWQSELSVLEADFPSQAWHPRSDNFGLALLSRSPIVDWRIVQLDASGVPTLIGRVNTQPGPISVVVTHPRPPVGPDEWRDRNDHLGNLAQAVRRLEPPAVLVGDLNIAPWSTHFQSLLENAKLVDSARGHGLHPTWPVRDSPAPGPPWLLAAPLDHILHSPDLVTVRRRTGPDVGSDHLPVTADLALP